MLLCEVVLCVSVIMGSESSKQAGAVEKRPPGSEALSSHYREGRPDNNGDIMRAGDRLSFSKWKMGRICSVPITTGSQPLIGPWPVLKRTALTALIEEKQMPGLFAFRKKAPLCF